ncbi:MAG: hypothetical protein Q9208_006710 [Pyrenodesmia sp. 3 TL-2023]
MGTTSTVLSPEDIMYQMKNINDNRGPEIVVATVILAVLATLAVILRFACRRLTKLAVSWDDYLIVVGLVFTLALCFCQAYGVESGSGQHILALNLLNVQKYAKLMYAYQMFWAFAMASIKVSILLFYRRLFPREATSPKWRMCQLALVIVSVVCCLISVFGSAFACIPVASIWDYSIQGARCLNLTTLARFTCVTGFITDILILTLPIPIVWSLQLDSSKKVGVCGVFLLGGLYVFLPFNLLSLSYSLEPDPSFRAMSASIADGSGFRSVCVASIIRFVYLEAISRNDPTWSNVDSIIWTAVEASIAIICACLPIMAPILRTKIVAVATTVFGSKKSPQATAAPSDGNTYKEKKGFARLVGTGPKGRSGTRQGSDGDEEMMVGTQTQEQGEAEKEGDSVGVHEIRL